ncbi:unnamed protein product [Diamesa serratosioi]
MIVLLKILVISCVTLVIGEKTKDELENWKRMGESYRQSPTDISLKVPILASITRVNSKLEPLSLPFLSQISPNYKSPIQPAFTFLNSLYLPPPISLYDRSVNRVEKSMTNGFSHLSNQMAYDEEINGKDPPKKFDYNDYFASKEVDAVVATVDKYFSSSEHDKDADYFASKLFGTDIEIENDKQPATLENDIDTDYFTSNEIDYDLEVDNYINSDEYGNNADREVNYKDIDYFSTKNHDLDQDEENDEDYDYFASIRNGPDHEFKNEKDYDRGKRIKSPADETDNYVDYKEIDALYDEVMNRSENIVSSRRSFVNTEDLDDEENEEDADEYEEDADENEEDADENEQDADKIEDPSNNLEASQETPGYINLNPVLKESKLKCDNIICPSKTHSCKSTVEAVPEEYLKIKTVTQCLSINNEVLATKNSEANNPSRGKYMFVIQTMDNQGIIKTSFKNQTDNDLNPENHETLEELLQKTSTMSRLSDEFQETPVYIKRMVAEFFEKLNSDDIVSEFENKRRMEKRKARILKREIGMKKENVSDPIETKPDLQREEPFDGPPRLIQNTTELQIALQRLIKLDYKSMNSSKQEDLTAAESNIEASRKSKNANESTERQTASGSSEEDFSFESYEEVSDESMKKSLMDGRSDKSKFDITDESMEDNTEESEGADRNETLDNVNEEGMLQCAGIKCPEEAFSCRIFQNGLPPNFNDIEIVIACLTENETVLYTKTLHGKNPKEGSPYHTESIMMKNGNYKTIDNEGNDGGNAKFLQDFDDEDQEMASDKNKFDRKMESIFNNDFFNNKINITIDDKSFQRVSFIDNNDELSSEETSAQFE